VSEEVADGFGYEDVDSEDEMGRACSTNVGEEEAI
jgi:hypothetical protein